MVFIDKEKYFSYLNDTGEEIPPYGCLIITGCTVELDEIVFSVRKCTQQDADLQEPASVLFNNIQPVPDGEYGVGTRDFPTQALIENDSLAAGTLVGPKFGTFVLHTEGSCFSIITKDETDPHIVSGSAVYLIEAKHGNTDCWFGKPQSGIPGRLGDVLEWGYATLYKINSLDTLHKVGGESTPKIVQVYNPGIDPILNTSLLIVWRIGTRYIAVGVCG